MAAVHPTLEDAAPLQDFAARDRLRADLRAAQVDKLDIEDLASLVKFAIRHGVTSVE